MHRPIEKIRKRQELKKETIKYFEVKTQNLLGFICYLVHKRLNNIPGRPAISKTWTACLNAAPIICFIAKTVFHIARHYNLTASVKKMIFL